MISPENFLKMNKFFLILVFLGNISFADENGASFWFCGQFASLIANPKNPFWSLDTRFYYLDNKLEYPNNQTVESSIPWIFFQPTYTPNTNWFNGRPSFTIAQGIANNDSKSSENTPQDITGLSDMYPFAEIAWNKENQNWNIYLMGGLPIGYYNPSSIDSLGVGHFSLDLGFGYTYFNQGSGLQGSGLLGFTYNFINPQTDYKNGIDSHLDYSLTKIFEEQWEAGIVGYLYYQLTPDTGNTQYGSFKSKAAAIGPLGSYSFNNKNLSLRAYWDFWKENRPGGLTIYADLNIEFPN